MLYSVAGQSKNMILRYMICERPQTVSVCLLADGKESQEAGKGDTASDEPQCKERRSRPSHPDQQTSPSVHWQTQARKDQPPLTTYTALHLNNSGLH